MIIAVGSIFVLHKNSLWDERLSSLSPVPEVRLQKDAMLRSTAGTTDMRYQLVSHSQDLETLLVESEEVDLLMQQAVDDGLVQS